MAEPHFVLDTSVVAAWFFTNEPLRAEALTVRSDVRDDPSHYVVPPLLQAELVHVLARKSTQDEAFVTEGLRQFLRLGVRTVQLSEAALLRTAYWACLGLSGYDATFAALAEDLEARWLTADDRAAKIAGKELALVLRDVGA